jgi:hypothetical protein
MKNFTQYLSEVQKTYEFRIKVANIDPAACMDRLKSALDTYSLQEISAVKRLPIQENVIEFPNYGPTEVYQLDVSLAYPCIDAQLAQLVAERCNLPRASIYVVPRSHPEEIWRNNEGELREFVQGENVLTQPLPEASAEQKAASKAYAGAETILKELTPTKDKWTIAGNDNTDGFTKNPENVSTGKTTNDIPQGNIDPVGSKQNAIPNPGKSLR